MTTLPDQCVHDNPENLLEKVYGELRGLASAVLRHERPNHTLQPTELAHEAYLRLQRYLGDEPSKRPDFMRLAAVVVRRVLLDHARKHSAAKRNACRIPIPGAPPDGPSTPARTDAVDLVILDRALTRLAAIDSRKAEVVQLRFFCGLTVEEIASCLSRSPRTVAHDWSLARAWLRRELSVEFSETTA